MSFSARVLLVESCSAAYTMPIPPSPILCVIRKSFAKPSPGFSSCERVLIVPPRPPSEEAHVGELRRGEARAREDRGGQRLEDPPDGVRPRAVEKRDGRAALRRL